MRKADNLPPSCAPLSRNLGTLASWNTQGLSRPVMGQLYLYLGYILCQKFGYSIAEHSGTYSNQLAANFFTVRGLPTVCVCMENNNV